MRDVSYRFLTAECCLMITPIPYQDPQELVRGLIRTVPDWPTPGVMFRDITPMLQDPRAFRALIDMFVYRHMRNRLDAVVGIDARGFIFGSALAYALNVGFVPVRKQGKLPFKTVAQPYSLEYGDATVEVHEDAIKPGQRVLLVDDLVATGGTMLAAIKLLQQLGGNVAEAAAVVNLPALGGSALIAQTDTPFFSVCEF
jgi:adenine phosphoribosyltransferase